MNPHSLSHRRTASRLTQINVFSSENDSSLQPTLDSHPGRSQAPQIEEEMTEASQSESAASGLEEAVSDSIHQEEQIAPGSLAENPTTSASRIHHSPYPRRDRRPKRQWDALMAFEINEAQKPKSYAEAMISADADKCKLAIKEEYDALLENKTWTLTEHPAGEKSRLLDTKHVLWQKAIRNDLGLITKTLSFPPTSMTSPGPSLLSRLHTSWSSMRAPRLQDSWRA